MGTHGHFSFFFKDFTCSLIKAHKASTSVPLGLFGLV
jgi:hypothetical protein